MARKKPLRTEFPQSHQIERALAKGRFADALELAKQHARLHPGELSAASLRQTYLTIIDRLLRDGRTKDATQLLGEAEGCGADGHWLIQLSERYASAGVPGKAQELVERIADPAARQRIMLRIADTAVADGERGRGALPPEMLAGFDLIRTAFKEYEEGQDEAARAALQPIGLQSPFLEWKVLLRGLMAYSAGDDVRAAENWQRLDPSRLPSLLAAPLRFRADGSFRAALLPSAAASLNKQFARLHAGSLTERLNQLQRTLGGENGLARCWNEATALVPQMRSDAPHLLPRLARVLYWSIVRAGDQADAQRYTRLFGPPADDPGFDRCRAMICEQHEQFTEAHRFWQSYEKWVAAHPERWPGPQCARVRALIWEHMGQNALSRLEEIEEEGQDDDNPFASFWDMIRGGPDAEQIRPLKPAPEECFQRAAALAPERLEPVSQLFRVYFEDGKTAQAEQVARDLLKRFPNDLPTLEAMAMLHEAKEDTATALDFRRRAVEASPLDRRLGTPFARVALQHARSLALAKQYEPARSLLSEALTHADKALALAVRCLTEAIDRKAGTLAAWGELTTLTTDALENLAAVYHRMVEAGRLKFKPADKKPLEKAFADLLEGKPPLGQLIPLLEAAELYRHEPSPYRGLQTHERKVWGLVENALREQPPEADLLRAGHTLLRVRAWKVLKVCTDQGRRRFKENPHFAYLEAQMHLNKNARRPAIHRAGTALRKALQLAQAAPDGRYRQLIEMIEQVRRDYPELEYHFGGGFAGFGGFFGDDNDNDDGFF